MKSIKFLAVPAVLAAAVIGLGACGGSAGPRGNLGGANSPGTGTNKVSWAPACAQTAKNTLTVSDENGNQATVIYCGYEVGDTVNGRPASAGHVFVSSVFKLIADQAASFDTTNGTYENLYTGNQANCEAATNNDNCPQLGTGGDSYAMDARGNVDPATSGANANFKPLFQDAPQFQVVTTQIAQPASTGTFVVVHRNGAMSTGNFSIFTISASARDLPITWPGTR